MDRQPGSTTTVFCLLTCCLAAVTASAQGGAAGQVATAGTDVTTASLLRGPSVIPSTRFNASTLDDWHTLRNARWHADRGEITGKGGADAGWLVLNHSYQDVGFYTALRCTEPCDTGVLLRISHTGGEFNGTFLSLKGGAPRAEAVTLNAGGIISGRQKLRDAGGTIRFALPPSDPNAVLRRLRPVTAPMGITLPLMRSFSAFRSGDWNSLEVLLDSDTLRAYLDDSSVGDPGPVRVATADKGEDYGPVALYVRKGTEVSFRDIGYRDIAVMEAPPDQVGSRFQVQRFTPYYYKWSAVADDLNQDGKLDIASEPYIYYAPGFTTSERSIRHIQ